ncbi:MAG: RING-HC finger protein [bacterium]
MPEHMMCVMCLERPKEVMIQTCKHMVFCSRCEHDYALKCTD